MAYSLTPDPQTIIRDEDGAFIPADPDNTDYRDYLAWLEEGNQPNAGPGTPTPKPTPAAKAGAH